MIFSQDRNKLRQFYVDVWGKFKRGESLTPLENQVAAVIQSHPEYHKMFETSDNLVDREFMPEAGEGNPFMHLGMHLGIQEQLGTQRPQIIAEYQRLMTKHGDAHAVEHMMMDCLGQMIWTAQQNNTMPNEEDYIECLKKLS